ncbi:hypothetical protein JHN61_11855 [Streptomyces sp. MBT67]|uniref:hypothetical protein n=1 Tax=unclassified Streptomyces TaxID=2593676 RepID=UPI001909D5D8|nr:MULTISPECIES: hypothetical protein [unclassified Streptomyces]MBK3534498.1 hypothetical protein [Streptomyces sp. MBT72]MBK3536905.1 hypothetical protein [Streptomyces sp. MBT67]MBK3548513.1 hypothetical protein [Streptomyces sp. MBT61]MBK6033588.1 hypothetical protein [Streptomyces sp. MBT59]
MHQKGLTEDGEALTGYRLVVSQSRTTPAAKSPNRYAAPHMKLVWTLRPGPAAHFRRWVTVAVRHLPKRVL